MKEFLSKHLKKILVVEFLLIITVIAGFLYAWLFRSASFALPAALEVTSQTEMPLPTETYKSIVPTSTSLTATEMSMPILHTVQSDETLLKIAAQYGLTLQEILILNPSLADPNILQIGMVLTVSKDSNGIVVAEPSPTPLTTIQELEPFNYVLMPSLISTDPYELLSIYPVEEVLVENELVAHYQPESFTALYQSEIFEEIRTAYYFVKTKLGYPFVEPIHIYLAGSVYQGDESLRGITHSSVQRIFYLVDGTWTKNERTYLFAHEFTHIFANYQLGFYRSPMLHEGLATYLPQEFMEKENHLSINEVCAVMFETDRLVPLNLLAESGYGLPYFAGHNRTSLYYDESACFVSYLIEQYGFENFSNLFTTLDYKGIYGRNIFTLDSELRDSLHGIISLEESEKIITSFDELSSTSTRYFNQTQYGQHLNFAAYLFLDQARHATFNGDYESAALFLKEYNLALGLE